MTPLTSPAGSDTALTLFFDGRCALCSAEMTRLHRWDRHHRLAFVDIARPDFSTTGLGVDLAALNTLMHSLTADGRLLVGIDSLLAAYTLTGRGWLVLPLRVPLLRPLLAHLYRLVARNRYRISAWFGYRPVPAGCDDGVCRRTGPYL